MYIVGRLTNALIDKLQVYYGLAIRRNTGNLQGMIKEISAGLHHTASSDCNPQHQFCPKEDSWCKYNIARANRQLYMTKTYAPGQHPKSVIRKAHELYPEYKHPQALPPAVVKELQPIYKRLSQPELLQKCMHGQTQNPCESFNSLLWQRCPKTVFSGRDHLDYALADAALHFNCGKRGHGELFSLLGLNIGQHSAKFYEISDTRRIAASTRKSSEKEKKIRQTKRTNRKRLDDTFKQTEGCVYEAGAGFDDN